MGAPVIVSPDEPRPTHHISLISPDKEIGLILCDGDGNALQNSLARGNLQTQSLKISQGNSQHSDLELPFNVTPQQDWSGGQNQERFEDNVTKYLEGYRVHGIFPGRLFNGPLDHFSKGYRNHWYNGLASVTRQQIAPTGSRKYMAVKVTPDANETLTELWLWLKAVGGPADLTVRILGDSAGSPNTADVKWSTSVASTTPPEMMGQWVLITIAGGLAVVSGTPYWIEVYAGAATDNDIDYWVLGCDADAASPVGKESANESSWSVSALDLYYRVCGADAATRGYYYRYTDARYFITAADSGTGAPKVYINGDRGAADSNTGQLSKLIDGTKAWTVDQFAGAVVQLTGGPGFTEAQNWRKVVSNTATELVVDSPWLVTHTTSTSYIIKGANTWREITGHGLTAPPSDRPFEVNGVLYIPQGNAVNIRRHREYNNAGTWVETDWADDGTNKADLMWTVRDATSGIRIWRVDNSTVKASVAAPVGWGSNLTFGSAEDIGDTWEKANRGVEYVDPETDEKIPWIVKQGSVWAKKDVSGTKRWDVLALPEMQTVASESTGRAALVHNTTLYFSLQNGLEQYFESVVTDLGPTKDRGLPALQRGPASALLGYPGRFFMTVDAGATGYSSVFMQNGLDRWEQHYRAPALGKRIRDVAYDVVPGSTPDRLWVLQGQDMIWLNMSSGGTNPLMDDEYEYCPESAVTSSRIHAGLQDVLKLWVAVKLVADDLLEDEQWIELDYKLDTEEGDWTTLTEKYDEAPSQEETLGDYTAEAIEGAISKFIVVRLRLCTTDRHVTPVLKAMLLDAIIRVVIKFGFAITVRIKDDDLDLRGQMDGYRLAKDKLADLDEMASGVQVLTWRSIAPGLDDLKVVIDPAEPVLQGLSKDGKATYIATIAVTQVIASVGAGS